MKWARLTGSAEREPVDAAIESAFDSLGERQALRLFARLSNRFSYSRGHDVIFNGVQEVANAAQAEGFAGDDLASRYLGDD